jgi:hypothetical protein
MTPNLIDENTINIQKLNEELKKNFEMYKQNMMLMSLDAPLGVLCLPKVVENLLVRNGCKRVYDIFNLDLAEIKGLGRNRLSILTSRLDEFVCVSF